MPELFFDIRFNANESDLKRVKDEANRIQKEVNEGLDGDATKKTKATQATREQVKAEKELFQEFQRQLTVNEVKFRQGELSQKQALQNAEAIERQAIETGVLTDSTLRGARAQKTMFLSQQRISTGFTGMASSSATANRSLVNLGRIVQDLPFGFLGISNNIDPALTSMRQLKDESGSTGGALKALLGSLKGSGGLIFALGSLLPTAVLIAQKGFNFYSKQTSEADKQTQDLSKSILDLQLGSAEAFDLKTINLTAVKTFEIAENFGKYAETIKDSGRRSALLEESERLTEQSLLAQDKANALVAAIAAQSRLNEVQVRSLLVSIEETDEQVKQNKVQRDYQELLLEERQRKVQLLEDQKLSIEGNSKLNALEKEQLDILDEILRRSQDEFKLEQDKLENQLEVGLITEEQFRLREQELINETIRVRDRYVEERDQIKRTSEARKQAIIEEWNERQRQAQERADNMPDAPQEDFSAETKALKQAEIAQQLITERQISQLEGLARRKAEIEAKYQDKIMSIGKKGLLNKEILYELDLAKKREIEEAKTDIEKQEAEKRRQINQKVVDTGFDLAGQYIGALSQLNSAQTDQTEEQARKKFEQQKKLQIASAIVNGLQAVVRQYSDLPLPAAIASSAVVAATVVKQIQAIKATKFNSGGSSPRATESKPSQTGFFTSDSRINKEPMKPRNDKQMELSVSFEDGVDEVISIKARNGNDRRKRSTFFTV